MTSNGTTPRRTARTKREVAAAAAAENAASAAAEASEPASSSSSSKTTARPKAAAGTSDGDAGGGIRAAARGTLVTLVLRIASFGCTQWTLRLVDDPRVLGRTSIELELLLNTVLFVSREGFRLALTGQRKRRQPRKGQNDAPDEDNSEVWNNVAWLSVPVSAIISTIALLFHLYVSTAVGIDGADKRTAQQDATNADYRLSGILYCLACCIEGLGEPPVLHALASMNVSLKAKAEGFATLGKTLTTVLALKYFVSPTDEQQGWPITSFGIAQLIYSIIYTTYLYSRSKWASIKPSIDFRRLSIATTFDTTMLYMVLIFTIQGLFKHLLTEGDRIVLTTLSDAYDQGVYAMGMSFGGIAARILLQPLEENARLLWSRPSSRDGNANDKHKGQGDESYTVLVKLVLYVGFVFSFIAVNYTYVLLNIVAGPKWGGNPEAATVLSGFCVYTAFLAWNGMTEAYVYATASSGSDVGELGLAHTIVGFIFAAVASWAVAANGTVGLVIANCVAMFCRAMYAVAFAARYFCRSNAAHPTQAKRSTLPCFISLIAKMLPHPIVVLMFVASFCATRWSQARMMRQVHESDAARPGTGLWYRLALEHVAVGASCAIGIVACAYSVEGNFRRALKRLWREKQA